MSLENKIDKANRTSWKQNAARIGASVLLPFIVGAYAKEAKGDLPIYPVCETGLIQLHPTIANNGTIIWADSRNGNYDIYAYDPSTGIEFPITTNFADQSNSSSGGNWVVFEDDKDATESRHNPNIYGYDLATGKEFVIGTEPSLDWHPATNGKEVVWQSYEDLKFKIKMWDPKEGIGVIYKSQRDQYNPSISERFVAWEEQEEGKSKIMAYDLQNKNTFTVFDEGGYNKYPKVSEDTIVWQTSKHGNEDIYTWTPTKGTMRITDYLTDEINPDVDGQRIVWRDGRYKGWGIVMHDFKNGEMEICTKNLEYKAEVSIRGNTVAFVTEKDNQRKLYVAKIPTADLNGDRKVNIKDFAIFAREYGLDNQASK